jgi:hypothetical protein
VVKNTLVSWIYGFLRRGKFLARSRETFPVWDGVSRVRVGLSRCDDASRVTTRDFPTLGRALARSRHAVPHWETFSRARDSPSHTGTASRALATARPTLGRLLARSRQPVPHWDGFSRADDSPSHTGTAPRALTREFPTLERRAASRRPRNIPGSVKIVAGLFRFFFMSAVFYHPTTQRHHMVKPHAL